jgi:hypothetical protein
VKKHSKPVKSSLPFKWEVEFTASDFDYKITLDPNLHKFLVNEKAVREDCYEAMVELNRRLEGPVSVKKVYLH